MKTSVRIILFLASSFTIFASCSAPKTVRDVRAQIKGESSPSSGFSAELASNSCDKSLQVKYGVLTVNQDGTTGDEVLEGSPIGRNSRYIVRTKMLDNRRDRKGIFSAYSNLAVKNSSNGPSTDFLFEWGQYAQLDFHPGTTGGSFKIRFQKEETKSIVPVFENGEFSFRTASTIKSALEALSNIGKGNVVVVPVTEDPKAIAFGFSFRGKLSRQVFGPRDLAVSVSALTLAPGAASRAQPTARFTSFKSNPSDRVVAGAGIRYGVGNYIPDVSNPGAMLRSPSFSVGTNGIFVGPNTLSLVGGVSNSGFSDESAKFSFVNIADQYFTTGQRVGKVKLSGSLPPMPTKSQLLRQKLGVSLFGSKSFVAQNDVCFIERVLEIQ